jgi:hypothetical protein
MHSVASQTLYLFTLTMALFGTLGCGFLDCERDGCVAAKSPRNDYNIARGIGGSVAYASDVVSNGCRECGFSSAELKVWATDAPVSDSTAARSVVTGNPPATTIAAYHTYERELDPGYYLVCQLPGDCASVAVLETGVFTVNVMTTFGSSSMMVFEPGTGTQRTEGVFDLSDVWYSK